jgi:hypothetical protein
MFFDVELEDGLLNKLTEILRIPSGFDWTNPDETIADWIENIGPGEVHRGGECISLKRYNLLAESQAMLELEQFFCRKGLLANRIDALEGSC